MNILFVVNNLRVGGAGRVVARLATQMQSMDHNVAILITANDEVLYPLPSDVKVYNLHMVDEKETKLSVLRIINRAKKIKKICLERAIDVVYSFLPEINIYSIIAGFHRNWTTIISERNDPNIDPPYKRVRLMRKLLYPLCDGVVFQTEGAKAYFSKKIQEKGILIFNPVSTDIPEPITGQREKVFVAAGRLNLQKNYAMMLKAFASFCETDDEYCLHIYGEGEERSNIEGLIRDLNLRERVILKGQSYNLLDEIKTASCYLLSSDYEGMSNSLIEAMALGLPIISTDHPIGGARALIINGKNGYLVPVNDYSAMAEQMRYVTENLDDVIEKAQMNISLRKKLSVAEIANQWLDFAKTSAKQK